MRGYRRPPYDLRYAATRTAWALCGGGGRMGLLTSATTSMNTPERRTVSSHSRDVFTSFRFGLGSLSSSSSSSSSSLLQIRRYLFSSLREMMEREMSSQKKNEPSNAAAAASSSFSSSTSSQQKLIRYASSVCPRSALFVPGHKPRALLKTLGLAADCFILDLEDSVGPGSKREAREGIRHFLEVDLEAWRSRQQLALDEQVGAAGSFSSSSSSSSPLFPSPRFVVRINSPDFDSTNALLDLELVAALGDRVEAVGIPKVTRDSFDKVKDYLHPDRQVLWAFFETPQSILEAKEILRATPAYKAAVMGYNDLMTELALPAAPYSSANAAEDPTARGGLFSGLSEGQKEALWMVSRSPLWWSATQVLMAARAAGHEVFVLDGVFNDPTDHQGFLQDLRACFSLGFQGKTLIHPSQIQPTNRAYNPSEAEVAWAREVESAVRASKGNVVSVRGKMIEGLHLRQATRLLSLEENAREEARLEAAAKEAGSEKSQGKEGATPGDEATQRKKRRG